jgi:quercetin dioxygenase-like cupin family protein
VWGNLLVSGALNCRPEGAWYDDPVSAFTTYGPPTDSAAGFRVVVGAPTGLSRLLLAVGRLPAGDVGPVHLHYGEEVLHVLDGRLVVRVGTQRRECGPGDVVTVAAGEWHGFEALEETVLEVVAEQRIGTVYPVRAGNGGVELVEVHRPDMPWGRAPRDGTSWTDDSEMRRIFDNLHPGA